MLILGQVFWVYINNTSTQINISRQALIEKNAEIFDLENSLVVLQSKTGGSAVEALQNDERIAKGFGRLNILLIEIQQIELLLSAQYIILADWVPEFTGDPKPDGMNAVAQSQ